MQVGESALRDLDVSRRRSVMLGNLSTLAG
jgi:hypothetical protein